MGDMCRVFAVTGATSTFARAAPAAFRELADCGCVPNGKAKGHRDGWGVAAYDAKGNPMFEKHPTDAFRDPRYSSAVRRLAVKSSGIVIAHFRKSSVGPVSYPNTHPFVHKKFVLCHNGSIYHTEKIPLTAAYRRRVRGKTDTEKLFYFILQLMGRKKTSATARAAFLRAVSWVRKHLDYTGMNLVFSDGHFVWALRDANAKNKLVKKLAMVPYYSLYVGRDRRTGARVVCSEKLPISGVRWSPLRNEEFVEINARSGAMERFRA